MDRLATRFALTDEATKAKYLTEFYGLKQGDHETGTAYLDRLNRVTHNLAQLGEHISDSAKLSKLLSSSEQNPDYQSLSRSIYATPGITFETASTLFEGYERTGLLSSSSSSSADHVSSVSAPSSGSDHNRNKRKRSSGGASDDDNSTQNGGFYSCMFCDSHSHSSYHCHLREAAVLAVRSMRDDQLGEEDDASSASDEDKSGEEDDESEEEDVSSGEEDVSSGEDDDISSDEE